MSTPLSPSPSPELKHRLITMVEAFQLPSVPNMHNTPRPTTAKADGADPSISRFRCVGVCVVVTFTTVGGGVGGSDGPSSS